MRRHALALLAIPYRSPDRRRAVAADTFGAPGTVLLHELDDVYDVGRHADVQRRDPERDTG